MKEFEIQGKGGSATCTNIDLLKEYQSFDINSQYSLFVLQINRYANSLIKTILCFFMKYLFAFSKDILK